MILKIMLYHTSVLNSIFHALKENVVISVTAFLYNPYGAIDKNIKDKICDLKKGILVPDLISGRAVELDGL